MRLRLTYRFQVQFPAPTRNVIGILRLTPRSHEGQRVTDWRIDVDPDCVLRAGEDHFGNLTHTLTVPGVTDGLVVTAQGELTAFDAAGVVRGAAERLPLDVFRRDTALTVADARVRAFAVDAARGTDNDIGRLHRLMGALHQTVTFRPEGEITAVSEAFAAAAGGCGDHAQIFVACARHLGFPARCATGFHLDHDGRSRRHAWAEAHVPDLGWIGFDTVHDICPQDDHVRVAIGLDAGEAAALRATPGRIIDEAVEVRWRFGRGGRPSAAATATA